jgi:hypothetical protein
VAADGTPARLFGKHQVPDVNNEAYRLSHNNHRVKQVDRVYQQRNSSQEAEPPKRDGDNCGALAFRGNPLEEKPGGKERLASEANTYPKCLARYHGPTSAPANCQVSYEAGGGAISKMPSAMW